jgi:hypothetical protein
MPRPPQDAGDAADRARHIIATSTDIEKIKVAQSVLLPLFGLDLDQTAQAIGKERYWVSRARNRFIRGESIGTHGGRRNAYFTEGQERELIESVVSENEIQWRTHLAPTLRKLLSARLDKETKAPVTALPWGSLHNKALPTRWALCAHQHGPQGCQWPRRTWAAPLYRTMCSGQQDPPWENP